MKAIALLLLLSLPMVAGEHKWFRRAWAMGACAMEGFDTASTFHAASIDPYGHEKVPFLRDGRGMPSPWRFAVVKSATCGVAVWAANSRHVNETAALSVSGLVIGQDVVRGTQNLGIRNTRAIWNANHPK